MHRTLRQPDDSSAEFAANRGLDEKGKSTGAPRGPGRNSVLTRLGGRELANGAFLCRLAAVAVGHLLLFASIYAFTFQLRFGFDVEPKIEAVFWTSLPSLLALKLTVFYLSGSFHGWWSHVTFADLMLLLRATTASLLIIASYDHFLLEFQIPRGVLLLDALLALVVVGGCRGSTRLFREHFRPVIGQGKSRPVLLVGSDSSVGRLAHHLHSQPELPYRVIGFLSTRKARIGSRLGNIPVLGTVENVGEIATTRQVADVLVTAGFLPGTQLRRLADTCTEVGLNLRIIPPLEDLFNGDSQIPIREIDIEDLLRRDPVQLDTRAIEDLLSQKTVMITGAGGSIGSEICRQVMKFSPRSLVLVGKGENRIFHIDRELRSLGSPVTLVPCIADIRDRDRMAQIFHEHRPDVVFHAAAHKHVPLMESNVGEAIKNNVLGTKCVADLAKRFRCQAFVQVSTDKAVHPSSIMGVSKHIAERYVHSLADDSDTRFVVTRFGNVLGSAGSVVPVFRDQIRRGGPITVTHADMTRFFMTIPEASQLVLQAAAMGKGGEIFVLDMGESVKIVNLARDLIRLSGLPEHAIEIVYTGVRPGEKLYEELYFDDEETQPTPHKKLRVAFHRSKATTDVGQIVLELEELVYAPEATLRERLHEIVPEYKIPEVHLSEASSPSESTDDVLSERALTVHPNAVETLPSGAPHVPIGPRQPR